MSCHIGRVSIIKNEGTIIFGDVTNNTTSSNMSNNNEGSTEGETGEVSLDSSRFSLTIPLNPTVSDAMITKRKKENRKSGRVQEANVKRGHRRSDV